MLLHLGSLLHLGPVVTFVPLTRPRELVFDLLLTNKLKIINVT